MKRIQSSPVADTHKHREAPSRLFLPLPLFFSPSFYPSWQREAISHYHTEGAGKAGYAPPERDLPSLSVSDQPFVALTHVHVLPLQAFESLLQLFEARATYEEFCIPMCMVPATISNNVPGTNLSIGADTALNAIVEVREAQINPDSRFTKSL